MTEGQLKIRLGVGSILFGRSLYSIIGVTKAVVGIILSGRGGGGGGGEERENYLRAHIH